MKHWYYSINANCREGAVHVVEQPWWLSFVEWFAHWVPWSWLHKVRLPNWPRRQWDKEDPDEFSYCTPREWFGDIGCIVLCVVTSPLIRWVYHHPKREDTALELGYNRVRDLFYQRDQKFFDEHEESFVGDDRKDGEGRSRATRRRPRRPCP